MTTNDLPSTAATDTTSGQLDLFAAVPSSAPTERGISRTVARACVAAGHWRHVAELYDGIYHRDAVTVHACHEIDGALVLEASRPGSADLLKEVLQRIHEAVARTCGCCGATPGHPYRATLEGPTRVACSGCRGRLQAGETEHSIADEYFRFDGSRRHEPWSLERPRGGVVSRAKTTGKRACSTLPPDELRKLIAEFRAGMMEDIVGQDDAVNSVSLLFAAHCGGGLAHGGRALILGPSGTGKTSLVTSALKMARAFDVATIYLSATDVTAPGWGGTPSVGELIETELHGVSEEGKRRCIVVIDEVHHIGVVPHGDITGNSRAHRQEVLSSLLAITGGGITILPSGESWSSQEALVIAMGAFTDLLPLQTQKVFSINELIAAGLPLEFVTRIAQETIVLRPLLESALVQLLRRWPALMSLSDLCVRLGFQVRVLPETIAHAARIITLGHDAATARTAGGWLVSALRHALMSALDGHGAGEIVLAPDSLSIPPNATRPQPPDDPPSAPGDWDATLVLTPRK